MGNHIIVYDTATHRATRTTNVRRIIFICEVKRLNNLSPRPYAQQALCHSCILITVADIPER